MGMIVSEGVTRARRAVGLTGGISLDEHVHPDLRPAAQLAGRVSLPRGETDGGKYQRLCVFRICGVVWEVTLSVRGHM